MVVQEVEIIRPQGALVKNIVPLKTVPVAGAESVLATKAFASAIGQLGEATFKRVEENAILQSQTRLSAGISRIENENLGNPAGLGKSLESFKKSFMKEIGIPSLRGKLEYQFDTHALAAMNRANAAHRLNVDQQAQVDTYLALDDIQTQMDIAAVGAYSKDKDIAAASTAQMQALMDRQIDIARQRSSDGSYLFGAESVANMVLSARDKTHTALAKSWFGEQENKLKAASDWLAGGVEYDLPAADTVGGFEDIDVDTLFKRGLIPQESGGNQAAVSPKGAIGVAQIMPATGQEAAALAGVKWDPKKFKEDAAYNQKLGRAYLEAQIKKYGNPTMALLAYNAGPGAVDDFIAGTNNSGKNPSGTKLGDPRNGETSVSAFLNNFPFQESRDYVRGIKNRTGYTTVNVRESMPSSTKKKVDSEIMSMLHDQIALERQQRVMQEAADRNLAVNTMADWVAELAAAPREMPRDSEAPQGVVTGAEAFALRRAEQIAKLNSQRQIFLSGGMHTEFSALMKSLISGQPLVEDGATLIQLKNTLASGGDISQVALAAMNDGRIGTNTYDELLTRQKTLRGTSGDAQQFLIENIGNSIAGLTPTDSSQKGLLRYNAVTSFIQAADKWRQDPANAGKTPSISDLKPFADEAIRMNILYDGGVTSMLNPPRYIPASAYSVIHDENAKELSRLIHEEYKRKHGDDDAKITSDPDFLKDLNWLEGVKNSAAVLKATGGSVGGK